MNDIPRISESENQGDIVKYVIMEKQRYISISILEDK